MFHNAHIAEALVFYVPKIENEEEVQMALFPFNLRPHFT